MTIQTDTTPAVALPPGRKHSLILRLMTARTSILLIAALLLVMYFQVASSGLFVTPTNAALLIRQTAAVVVAAGGVAILIIMGEIDLSIGSVAFLSGLVAASCQVGGWGVAASVLAAVAVGAAIGLVQGLVITRLAVPAFVVTLGGLLLWRGLGLALTDAAAIGPVSSEYSALTEGRMPTAMTLVLVVAVLAFTAWSAYRRRRTATREFATRENAAAFVESVISIGLLGAAVAAALLWIGLGGRGLPNAILWIATVVIVLDFTMTRAQFGRRAFLVGSNHEAAMYAGINVRNIVLFGFVLMGAIAGIAGMMLIARVGTSTANSGVNLELTAIAAAVIGGVSLRGGIGSIRGALMGAFLLSTIDNGMSLLGVSSYAQSVVKALILVLAVALDGYFTRRQLMR